MTFETKEKLAAALALAAFVAAPGIAHACDGCLAAQSSAVQRAFIVASVFLSVTPLTVIGALVWWLRRRYKQFEAEEEAGVIHLPLASRQSRR